MIFELIFRSFDAVIRYYRKCKFRHQIGCPHKNFSIVGNVTLINRNIILGNNVTLYPGVMFWGDGPIVIGDNVDIGNGTILYSSKGGGITIGNNTVIAAQCYIIDMDHGVALNKKISEQSNSVSAVRIGTDCWLGANVTVLKGSIINNGAVVGAKGLVKGEVEAYSINVGIPCKKLKYRC